MSEVPKEVPGPTEVSGPKEVPVEMPAEEEEVLKAEISLKQMKLIRGLESFVVPREYFRAVYDAMMDAVKMKEEDEAREVLLEKKLPGQPGQFSNLLLGQPAIGRPEPRGPGRGDNIPW